MGTAEPRRRGCGRFSAERARGAEGAALNQVRKRCIGITEVVRMNAHSFHEREVESAEFSIWIFAVIEHPSSAEGSAAAAR